MRWHLDFIEAFREEALSGRRELGGMIRALRLEFEVDSVGGVDLFVALKHSFIFFIVRFNMILKWVEERA
jgi:hypothetical protein